MGSEVYEKVNTAWKDTCRVLLGEEIGELNEYKDWLQDYAGVPRKEKSTISEKQVTFSIDEYCKDAKFISFDELDFYKKFEPLNINEIKDVDSIVEALQERFYYTGNITLGNSKLLSLPFTRANLN